jgi:hypothetical protein
MFGFLKKIFIGSKVNDEGETINAYKQQARSLKQIWNDHTYGMERLFRLFLCLVQFIYPTLLVKNIFGGRGITPRKLAVELYIVMKLFFPALVLMFGLYRYDFVIIIIIYLLSETIFHILNLIFLSDIYSISVVFRRSILFLFLHYIEVVLDFSAIYLRFDLLNKALTPISAVYYSFVTNTTLGYGDYHPKGSIGQVVVIFQLIIFIMFVVLFINYFSSRINDKN